jgi:hypothetical protein
MLLIEEERRLISLANSMQEDEVLPIAIKWLAAFNWVIWSSLRVINRDALYIMLLSKRSTYVILYIFISLMRVDLNSKKQIPHA